MIGCHHFGDALVCISADTGDWLSGKGPSFPTFKPRAVVGTPEQRAVRRPPIRVRGLGSRSTPTTTSTASSAPVIPIEDHHYNAGAMRVRFYHAQNGSATHDLYVDYVGVR